MHLRNQGVRGRYGSLAAGMCARVRKTCHMADGGRADDLVCVLDWDPDLGQDLGEEQLTTARGQALASWRCFGRGAWVAPPDLDPVGSLGLLIVNGFIVRTLTVAEYTCTEFLGPGDVLQPWLPAELEQPDGVRIEWTVIQQLRVVLLDRDFTARIGSWPEIAAAVSRRLAWRTHLLALQLAIGALRRIDNRVLLMLWQLAGRWGTVTPDGVLLDIPLTHELLASAIGARRPSVSAAVRRLIELELISARPRSRWLLLGGPPNSS